MIMKSAATRMSHSPHSAHVQMHLKVGEAIVRIAQLGPDFVILAEKSSIVAERGELIVRLDGSERRKEVRLPAGLAPPGEITKIALPN